jgi:CheY-like chemotaxis protein
MNRLTFCIAPTFLFPTFQLTVMIRSVLYVDNDVDDHEIFCETIHRLNPETLCAVLPDGKQALAYLENTILLPDYIFLDVNMPIMGGVEFLQRVKKSDRFKKIPIIMYSTTKDHEAVELCKRLGALDFIVKASTMLGVETSLRKYIG